MILFVVTNENGTPDRFIVNSNILQGEVCQLYRPMDEFQLLDHIQRAVSYRPKVPGVFRACKDGVTRIRFRFGDAGSANFRTGKS